MKVTHILYLSEKNGLNPFSGVENHLMVLLPELVRHGVDTELIVLLWNPGKTIARRLEELRQTGVRVVVIERDQTHLWKGRLWRAIECWRKLHALLISRRDRIVHIHLDLIAAVTAARFAGCRMIVSVHNDEPCYASIGWRAWLRLIDRWVSAYISITRHVQRYYLTHAGVDQKKISIVYYGLAASPRRPTNRKRYGIAPERFVVGFIGRLTEQKNVRSLIEAAAEIPQALFIIVGDGELRSRLEHLAKVKRVANVQFWGVVPDAAHLMPLFDVFCLPSRWEGLGLVLLEAMLHRVPIVASNAGAIPEILENGECGLLFDPSCVSSLVQRLRYAIANAESVRDLADRGYLKARSQFTVEQMAANTRAVYCRVMAA